MANRILVAGVGNIFLGDDAFGVEVAQRLVSRKWPSHVDVRDFGIRSYDLAYALMDDWDLVILVDAVPAGGEPGTVYTIEPELPAPADAAPTFDAHTMHPVVVMQLVQVLGGQVPRIIIVGCEPASIESDINGGIALSPPVHAAVDEAIRVIEEIVSRNTQAAVA